MSRTSDDIDVKLGPVTKLEKRNKTMSKKFDVDVMSENCDVIVLFRIFGQFKAVRGPDSESEKVILSVIVTFCLTKTKSRTKKSLKVLFE